MRTVSYENLTEAAKAGMLEAMTVKKGLLVLKAKAPKSDTLGYAAWQALTINWNPYKASIAAIMFMNQEQMAVYNVVNAFAEANMHLRYIDRDRMALETLGVW
jgi:hypothetical protein